MLLGVHFHTRAFDAAAVAGLCCSVRLSGLAFGSMEMPLARGPLAEAWPAEPPRGGVCGCDVCEHVCDRLRADGVGVDAPPRAGVRRIAGDESRNSRFSDLSALNSPRQCWFVFILSQICRTPTSHWKFHEVSDSV